MNDFTLLLDGMEREDSRCFLCLAWRIMKELESCREFRALSSSGPEAARMMTFIEEIWDREIPLTYQTAINRQRFFQSAAEAVHLSAMDIKEQRNKKMRSKLRKMGYKHMPLLPVDEEDISRFMTKAIARYEKRDRAKADLQKLKFYLGMTTAELAELFERPEEDVTADGNSAREELAKFMKQVAQEEEQPLRKPKGTKG